MIIPKYSKEVNSYAAKFLKDFYANLDCFEDVSDLNLKDRNMINDVLTRYYCTFFTLMHQEDKKLMHHPELATSFNFIFCVLMTEITCIYFFTEQDPPLGDLRKKLSFETLVKRIGFKLHNLKQEDLTNGEIVSKLFDYIYDKHKELFENEYIFDSDWGMTDDQKLRKYNLLGVINELSQTKFDDLKTKFAKIFNFDNNQMFWALLISIIPFAALFFFLPALCLLMPVNNYERVISVGLVAFFYVSFFTMFGYMLISCIKAKNKLDVLESYESYYANYYKLGVDVLSIIISTDLLNYVDPERQNKLIPVIADFRLNLIEKHGFVMPMVRVLDDKSIGNHKVIVKVRGRQVSEFEFSPNRYVISEESAVKNLVNIPKKAIKFEYNGKFYYWIKDTFFRNISEDIYMTRDNFIKFVLNDIVFKYIDKIFTVQEAFATLEMVKSDYHDDEIYSMTNLNILDFREIFIKIIEKGGSLKDLDFVFERIINHSKTSQDKDFIAFSVCQDIAYK